MSLARKTVLVTGAGGFIGSHLVESLVPSAGKVKALVHYNSLNRWGWLDGLEGLDDVELHCGDVRDPGYCEEVTKGVDVVFHLAALIGIPYSYVAPLSYVETNVKGTLNLCIACLKNGCARLIHTSTSEVYGTARYVPIDEDHPLQPQSPYSASKISADAMAMSFRASYDLPLTIVRPFNTFGPRQSARAVIPTIIVQLASGKEVVDLGALEATRDFTYVADTCRGFVAAAERDEAVGEVLNIGSSSEVAIGELFQLIRTLMGKEARIAVSEERLRPIRSEVLRLVAANGKARRLLGFEPAFTLREGLEETIAWFSRPENLRWYRPDVYNV